MLKLLSVFVSTSTLFIISLLFGSEPAVYVTQDTPTHVSPGSEFIVKMTIHKGKTFGFARIQQFIPDGFRVEVVESANAQFIEEGNSIKFIWTQMPPDENFNISYKVFPKLNVIGLQVINGVLIYIEDEKTEQYALPPIEINISSSEGLANENSKPQVERVLTATVPELNEYRVQLTIHPKEEESSARFIDQIPEGYEAFSEQSHGAHFLFAEGVVTFTWLKMPKDTAFNISYLVRSAQRRTPPSINGMLVYGNSAMNMKLDSIDTNDELYEQALKSTDQSAENILNELLTSEKEKESAPAAEQEIAAVNSGTQLMIPSAKGGISYKVQISATIKSPARNNDWFNKYYKIDEPVDLTYHDGWKKYLIGAFDNFKAANLHKRKTREKVSDAFVVAYQDGQRISVKEAMASQSINQ